MRYSDHKSRRRGKLQLTVALEHLHREKCCLLKCSLIQPRRHLNSSWLQAGCSGRSHTPGLKLVQAASLSSSPQGDQSPCPQQQQEQVKQRTSCRRPKVELSHIVAIPVSV